MESKNEDFTVRESKNGKSIISQNYNSVFNKNSGFSARWGKSPSDDPEFCEFGPEIADIEISEICHGINNIPCKFCYKSNTGDGNNMSLETFKIIFDKFPKTLTQIALGIGDIDSNPDLWKIMDYCKNNRKNEVIPNVTINGWNLTDEYAQKLKQYCGAVAVSKYSPKDVCYDAVKKLTDLGMTQINIHMLVSEETFNDCLQTIKDAKEDQRLKHLNAIVFLMLKPKGRGSNLTKISKENYKTIIDLALEMKINFGMDSCSASSFLEVVKDKDNYAQLYQMVDSCESTLFSIYINSKGMMFPCSFTEGLSDWEGVDVTNCSDFLEDIWNSSEAVKFRNMVLNNKCEKIGCNKCPIYKLEL